jgi:membrane protein
VSPLIHPSRFVALKSVWDLLRDTFAEWSKDGAPVLGAALAFYTLFSLAPLLIIITVVIGYFLGQEAVQADLLSRMTVYVGEQNAHNLMEIIQNTYRPGSGIFATVIAGSLMLFGSTSVFLMLKSALNHMWGVNNASSGFWSLVKDRGKSFLVVLCVGLLMFLSIVLKSLLAAFYTSVSEFLVVPGFVIYLIDHNFSILSITALFTILYKVLPDARVSWGYAARGAFVSALLFSIGNIFLGLYLTRQGIASAYGAAGSLVVILMWVFYSSQIIFLGAEFTQVYARKYGKDLEAKPLAPDPAKKQ